MGYDCQVTYSSVSTSAVKNPWVVHEAIVSALHLGLQKILRSVHMAGLVDCDQLVRSCGNHHASCNPLGARVHSHVFRERPIITSAETGSGTRAGQGTKH